MVKIKKILSGYNFLIVYLLLIIFLDFLLQFFPLTNVFGYEYSVANSFIIVFLTGLFSISTLKKNQINGDNSRRFLFSWVYAFSLFLIIPPIISVVHSILTMACSLKDGALFYIVITMPALLVGIFLGLTALSISRKFSILVFILLFILILLTPILEFYFNPQVFFFNPVFGIIQGTIYDETFKVTNKFLIYRILNSLYFGAGGFLLLYSLIKTNKVIKWFALSFSLMFAVLFIYISPLLGYSTTFTKLDNELSHEVITKHFIIHFPPQIGKEKMEALALYHEFFYSQLKNFFGFGISSKLNSYIFLNDKQKEILYGTANADMAKPWLNSIFVTANDYDKSLKHEIAHCFSDGFGENLISLSLMGHPFLVEGIAVAAAPVIDDNTVDYLASLAYRNGYRIDLNLMFNGFSFYTQASTTSYIYAGSFVKYLIKKYGINKFGNLFRGEKFQKVYGIDLNSESKEYFKFINQYDTTGTRDEANYYFGRKSIFYKVCPRYISEKLVEAWNFYNEQNYFEAKKIFENILRLTDNYSAVIGFVNCISKIGNKEEAISFLLQKINSFKRTAYYYNIELTLADLLVDSGQLHQADSLYSEIVLQNPSQTLFNLACLRIELLRNTNLLKPYLEGSDYDKYFILNSYNLSLQSYSYSTFLPIINLSQNLNESYSFFLKHFSKPIEATDYISSYAIYKLSDFMLFHLDYTNAGKAAAMALRYKGDKNFNTLLEANYEKTEWFFLNHSQILNETKFLTKK